MSRVLRSGTWSDLFGSPNTYRGSRDGSDHRSSIIPDTSQSIEPSTLLEIEDGNEKTRGSFEWEVKYNKQPLSLVGLWPLDDKYRHVKFILCLLLFTIYSSPSIVRIGFIGAEVSFDGPLQIIMETTPLMFVLFQFSMMKFNSHRMKSILVKIYEDWDQSAFLSDDDKKPMLFYGGRTRNINLFFIINLIVSCLGYWSEPLIQMAIKGTARKLPNKGLYPFETTASPNYEIAYLMQTLISFSMGLSIISIDGFLILSVFHGCGQLAVLCNIIGHYKGQESHGSASSDDSRKKFNSHCSCLKCIVERHVSVSKYVEMVDELYNGIVMVRLMLNTLNFCAMGYIIIKSNRRSKFFDLFLHLVYMGGLIFSFFICCWMGDQLLEEGENVGRTIYKLDWHKVKPKVAQSLILPMLSSRRPLKLTAGRFFVMSLSCFKEWLINSVGYLSVLLAIERRA